MDRLGVWQSEIGPRAGEVGTEYGEGGPSAGESQVGGLRGRTENMWKPDGLCQNRRGWVP